MKIDLEVLASTAIKRKKPWPKIIWIGEQQESLLLLDAPGKRISVLFVPSGMTKKKLPGISPLSKDFKSFNSTTNGRYLLAFLDNGEICIWHKDKDVVKYIAGFPKLDEHFQSEICHLDASDDCSYLLVAVGKSTFYLWIMEKGESILKSGDNNLKGEWHKLTISEIDLPSAESRESTVSSIFYSSPSLGHCCQLSLVFNKEDGLCVTTLLLRFPDPAVAFGRNLPKFTAEWSQLEYPFQQVHPDFERISTPGSYVSSYSGSGQVLAVAANQRAPNKTTMLFISPITDTVLVGDMKGCGIRDRSKTGRHYWITYMSWMCDSLFLAVMFKNGSVCLIPRLGEPVAIQTQGCSVDMGPALYLPLHPAILVSGDSETLEPGPVEMDPMQQQFSLATHPTLPIMLFSDGFLVTVVQMGADLTSATLMRSLVLDSAVYLKKLLEQENLDMTVADAYKLSRGHKGSKPNLAGSGSKGKRSYQFEMEELSLNATQDSDTSVIDTSHAFGFDQLGAIGNMDAGKITFDEPEIITMDPNATFRGLDGSESLLKYLERSMSALTLVWKLGASYSDVWTTEVDNVLKQTVHNLCKIFTVVLDCPAVDAIIPSLTPRQSSAIQNPRVYNVIVGYRNLLQLLRFDRYNQHLIPAALKIVHNTISIMLTSKQLKETDPRIKTLSGCFSLLKHAESSLNRNYVWGQSESGTGTPTSTGRETGSSQHTVSSSQLPGRRLAASWKLLYKHTTDYQQTVTAAGDVNNELPLIGKLLSSVQQVLQDSEAKITPRRVAAKITAEPLDQTLPFGILTQSGRFVYSINSDSDSFTSGFEVPDKNIISTIQNSVISVEIGSGEENLKSNRKQVESKVDSEIGQIENRTKSDIGQKRNNLDSSIRQLENNINSAIDQLGNDFDSNSRQFEQTCSPTSPNPLVSQSGQVFNPFIPSNPSLSVSSSLSASPQPLVTSLSGSGSSVKVLTMSTSLESPVGSSSNAGGSPSGSGYTTQSTSVFGSNAQSPVLNAQSPGLNVQSPGLDAQSPKLNAQSPELSAQSPQLNAQSPQLGKEASMNPILSVEQFGNSHSPDQLCVISGETRAKLNRGELTKDAMVNYDMNLDIGNCSNNSRFISKSLSNEEEKLELCVSSCNQMQELVLVNITPEKVDLGVQRSSPKPNLPSQLAKKVKTLLTPLKMPEKTTLETKVESREANSNFSLLNGLRDRFRNALSAPCIQETARKGSNSVILSDILQDEGEILDDNGKLVYNDQEIANKSELSHPNQAKSSIVDRETLHDNGKLLYDDQEIANKCKLSTPTPNQSSQTRIVDQVTNIKVKSPIVENVQQQLSLVSKEIVEIQSSSRKDDTTRRRHSDKLSVDGDHTLAVEAWKEELRKLAAHGKDNAKTAQKLHAVLYTYLLRDELAKAVDFIDNLIFQASIDIPTSTMEMPAFEDGSRPPLMTLVTHRSQDSQEEELVPCIRNKSIRKTVQTMARFMAAYFSNKTLFIYHPTSAKPLTALHTGTSATDNRIIPKYQEEITNIIRRSSLTELWSTERTVEYLILSGLICETVWFAHSMGDWKTAFLLSVAHTSHREIAHHLYKRHKKPLYLPEYLTPHCILQDKLLVLIQSSKVDSAPGKHKHCNRYFLPVNKETNIDTLTKTLQDVLTAGIISDVEVTPWLLMCLTEKLKTVIATLPPLVPQGFYLPAPPLFCPQPGEMEMGYDTAEVQQEKELRLEISSIIQLVLVALNSACLSLPVSRWYVQELFKVQERAAQFKATTEGPCLELPEILQQYKILRSNLSDISDSPNVSQILSSFRDFSTLLWLLQVRDDLSLHLRQRGSKLGSDVKLNQESPVSTLGQDYIQECFQILKSAVNMLAFSHFLRDCESIQKVILSLIQELPATEDTADVLAEHFYAAETLDPEVKDKLERLVASWKRIDIVFEDDGKSARPEDEASVRQSVENDDDDDDDGSVRKSVTFFQASPRAKTLSVYYEKQREVVRKVLKKKRKSYGLYEEFVFAPGFDIDDTIPSTGTSAERMYIGSRPFETKQSYLEFLDRFYAICFSGVVQQESSSTRKPMIPILSQFSKQIREVEFQAFLTQYEETIQKRPTLVMATPRNRSHSESYVPQSPASAGTPQHKSLFRSVSSGVGDIPNSPVAMRKYDSEMALPTQARSTSKVKPNMTVMASRFFKSEEVLYGEPVDTQENHWILNVNFGQRYLALQTLLDYLYNWAGKQHSLGLRGKSQENAGLKPRMRIEVPTQLIVLGLWLLDNKYSGKKVKAEPEIIEKATAETMTEALPSAQTKQKILATVEELTERDSLTQVSNMPRSRSISPAQRSSKYSPRTRSQNVSRSQSAGFDMTQERTLDYIQSINSTHDLHSQYEKWLNDGEASSSLEVSSLEATELQNGLSEGAGGFERRSRKASSRQRSTQRSSRQVDSSPDSRNNSAFNNTLQFAQSPDRSMSKPPQTSTPVRGNRSKRMTKQERSGQLPPQYDGSPQRSGHGRQMVSSQMAPVDLQGLDLPGQIQQIVRGELRRMLEVQHQSMINMIGALDGTSMPQQVQSTMQDNFASPDQRKGKRVVKGALQELRNLQNVDSNPRNKSGMAMCKENREFMDSALRMSHLHGQGNVDVYRIEQGGPDEGFYPRFLKLHAEKENCRLQFPQIPREAWQSGSNAAMKQPGSFDMPLLHVDRSVPAHKFPVTDRGPSIPRYMPEPGYFTPPGQPSHLSQPPSFSHPPPSSQPPRQVESPDSGIGIPLLRLKTDDYRQRQPPRFGELLPPDMVIESGKEAERKEHLRERYLREYHDLQAEKATADYKRGFGEHLLQLRIPDDDEEEVRRSPTPRSPRKTKTPSPRKTPRSISELSSRASRKSRQPSAEQVSGPGDDADVESEGRQQLSEKQASDRGKKSVSIRVSEQGAESEDEDATEAESVTDEEEGPIHDGYAFKKGEFEAYLALENALAKTKDTHARIQLKTALRMQRQRMMENWKKVDFATNTTEEADIGLDPVDFPSSDHIRYSEKATSITKDTGVDPIQEAVIEYNQSRQANVLPPDIYMGLRFGDTQQDSDGQQQDSQGRRFLNVVDLNASLVLKDLREKPEPTEPNLDVSLTAEQRHLRHRIDREDLARDSYEAPVIQRPTRADELTVKMFDTSVRGEDRLSLAIMPRDSLPDSKQAIIQRLREMNSQLAAIDQMSNNIERDYKSTRLAIHTLEEMNAMMEPPTKEEVEDFDSKSPPHTLTPQPLAKSPTPTARSTTVKSTAKSATQSTHKSKKSTLSKQEQGELSAELAKVSGLSGISDIIGDMVAKGEIDLENAGLSKQEADRLVQRGIIKQDSAHEVEFSLDEIKRMADTVQKDTGRDRDELRTWMIKKRQERMHEYKQQLDQLRERETRPFRSTHANMDQSFTQREHDRQESRKATKKAFMTQRLEDAQKLLGNILSEKPDIPVEPPAPSPRRRTDRSPGIRTDRSPASVRDRSPLKKKTTREITPVKKPKGILKSRETSPTYWEDYDINGEDYYDDYLDEPYMPSHRERSSRADNRPLPDQRVPDARPIQVQPRPEPSVRQIDVSPAKSGRAKFDMPRLKLSLDDVDEEVPRMQQTGNTTAEITEYYKAMEAMDMSTSDVQPKLPKSQSQPDYQPAKQSPKKSYKPKPFHEIVRLQRPEATRKKPNKYAAEIAMRAKYMSECETVNTSARAELTQREKEKIYGSKHLPSARKTETAPRRVKTYTERLHEMKPKEKYTTKLVPKSHYALSVQSSSARPSSRPVKPKHKPVTYVEQLQKLNAGHHKPKGMGTKTTVLQKTFIRSHKPIHKPKTYAEQLQDLQPGKTFTGPPSKRSHKSGAPRQRPYRDPYMEIGEGEPTDAMSVISDWSMGDNIRQILYDDDESIAVGQSASYAPSEQVSDYYNAVMGDDDDYTASVDIDELVQIADGGSVSSGSMMSCIDWDQVDDLIADVR